MSELIPIDKRKSIATLIKDNEKASLVKHVDTYLASDRFNFVVTDDTLPLAKTSLAELRKSIVTFKSAVKEKVDQESLDIVTFNANAKDIVKSIDAVIEKLDKGVSVFTEKARAEHKQALTYALTIAYDTSNIRPEFKDFSMLDGMLSTAPFLNADGKTLKKPYRDKIENIIETAKGKQAQEDLKIAEAEAKRKQDIADAVEADRKQRAIEDDEKIVKERKRLEKEKNDALEQQRKELEQKPVPDSSIAVPVEKTEPVPTYTEPQKGTVEEQKPAYTPPANAPVGKSTYWVHIDMSANIKDRMEAVKFQNLNVNSAVDYSFVHVAGFDTTLIEAKIIEQLKLAGFDGGVTVSIEEVANG